MSSSVTFHFNFDILLSWELTEWAKVSIYVLRILLALPPSHFVQWSSPQNSSIWFLQMKRAYHDVWTPSSRPWHIIWWIGDSPGSFLRIVLNHLTSIWEEWNKALIERITMKKIMHQPSLKQARENGSYGHGAEYLWMRNQEEMTQVRGIWLALLDRVLAEGRPGLPGILWGCRGLGILSSVDS